MTPEPYLANFSKLVRSRNPEIKVIEIDCDSGNTVVFYKGTQYYKQQLFHFLFDQFKSMTDVKYHVKLIQSAYAIYSKIWNSPKCCDVSYSLTLMYLINFVKWNDAEVITNKLVYQNQKLIDLNKRLVKLPNKEFYKKILCVY